MNENKGLKKMLKTLSRAIHSTLANTFAPLQPLPALAGAAVGDHGTDRAEANAVQRAFFSPVAFAAEAEQGCALPQDHHELEDILALADELQRRPRVLGACASGSATTGL